MPAEKDHIERNNSMEDGFSEDIAKSVDSLINEVSVEKEAL